MSNLDRKLRREGRRIVLIESGIRGGVSVEIRPYDVQGGFGYGHREDRFVRFVYPDDMPEWMRDEYHAPPDVQRAVELRSRASAEKYARSLGLPIYHREAGGIFGIPRSRWIEEAP